MSLNSQRSEKPDHFELTEVDDGEDDESDMGQDDYDANMVPLKLDRPYLKGGRG